MSEICDYCGVVSRSACSTYKRKYRKEAIETCSNLETSLRAGALSQAGFFEAATALYGEQELDRLREENAALRRRLGER